MASRDELKRNAAEAALAYVKPGMVLGLGTGSTARHFLAGVGHLVANGMDLKGVPTSLATAEEAKRLGIPLTSLEESFWLDLTVDGADEVDPKLDLIKGMGGALFREKIVAAASKKFVIIVDDSKLVRRLGTKTPLPVEVDPFDLRLFFPVDLRKDVGPRDAEPVRMDGSALAFLLDVPLVDPFPPPEFLHRDADLRLTQARGLLDLHRRRLVAIRKEYEGLRDVPRQAGLDQQVHQRLVPPTEADLPARWHSPPFINLAIYICCDATGERPSQTERSRGSGTPMDRFSLAAEAVSTRWTWRPRNPQIAVLLCIDARSPLHEDAPAYPRLLSLLQQARRARGRAGEE